MKLSKLCLMALSLCFASSAFAGEVNLTHRIGLGLGAGASIPLAPKGQTNGTSTSFNVGAWGRYHFTNALGIELAYDRLQFRSASMSGDIFDVAGFYRFMADSKLSPVAWVGVGIASVSNSIMAPASFTSLALKGRIGLEYMWCDHLSVGAYATYQYVRPASNSSNETHALVPALAATWYFGGEERRAPVREAVEPAPAASIAAVETDDDHDGVINSKDRCPNTPAGEVVDAFGCSSSQRKKVEISMELEFASGKSKIEARFHDEIEKVAAFMKAYPNAKARIEGYCDNTGKAKTNLTLSQARADAVRGELVNGFGVNGSNITSKGFGSAHPVASNKTAAGRKQNRRVIAVITGEEDPK